MFTELKRRLQKVGQPPGTLNYLQPGQKSGKSTITAFVYNGKEFFQKTGANLAETLPDASADSTLWLHVEGLHNLLLIEEISEKFNLHPLTKEDIANITQRPKTEEFDHYLFITIKILQWDQEKHRFTAADLDLVIGKNFLLTFQDQHFAFISDFLQRINKNPTETLHQISPDYLAYRFIDFVIDHYFVVLDEIGNQIEKLENLMLANPSKHSLNQFYHLRHQLFLLRKIIWPMREVISNLLRTSISLISSVTQVYLRDVYDHIAQAMDTAETFREMVSNIVDIYLSNLSYRMNEIMKVLTIIMTTFIPISFIASLYGMNFKYMPELSWHYSYPVVLVIMVCIAAGMLWFYRYKKWW